MTALSWLTVSLYAQLDVLLCRRYAVKEGHKLDIKEIILLGGGLLLVAVIGLGIWVARRSRQGDLKMDISVR